MEIYERKNVACNTFGEGLWGFGWTILGPLTVLPVLIRRLGGGSFEVGILAALVSAGSLLPQLLGSLLIQTGQGKKKFLLSYHLYAIAPPWLLLGFITLFLSGTRPALARFLLIGLISLSVFAMGLIVPIWLDWLAGIFRKSIRGLAFGLSSSASALGGALAAILAAVIIARISFPVSYALLFFIAVGFFIVSIAVCTFIKDDRSVRPPEMSSKEVFGRFRSSLANINFRRYLAARSMVAVGAAAASFYAIHYLSDGGGGVASQTVVGLGALISVAQALFSTAVGRLGDKIGHRVGVTVGVAAQALSIGCVILFPGALSCGFAFALTGIGIAGAIVSHQNFLFETCPHDSRTAHITVANLVLAPVTILAPLAVGKAIEIFGTGPVFGVCLAATLLGLIWIIGLVKNPEEKSPAEY